MTGMAIEQVLARFEALAGDLGKLADKERHRDNVSNDVYAAGKAFSYDAAANDIRALVAGIRRPALRGRARCRHCTQPFEPGDRCPARASALGPLPCEAEPC